MFGYCFLYSSFTYSIPLFSSWATVCLYNSVVSVQCSVQDTYCMPVEVFTLALDKFFQSVTRAFLKPYSELMTVRGCDHYAYTTTAEFNANILRL